jgi:hypothetical protein
MALLQVRLLRPYLSNAANGLGLRLRAEADRRWERCTWRVGD